MTKITITNFNSRMNKGSTALVNSTITTLSFFISDLEFTIVCFHMDYNQYPLKLIRSDGVPLTSPTSTIKLIFNLFKCTIWYVMNKHFNKKCDFLLNTEILKNYFNSDVIINTGGDNLTEDYGSPFTYFANILMPILLNKPVVLYAESIDNFKRWWNKIIVNFIFNRVSLITVREKISEKNLMIMNITQPQIFITADSAFLLEASNRKNIEKIFLKEHISKTENPLIGISVSKIISSYGQGTNKQEKYENYKKIIVDTINYLTRNLNATVFFIPHVIGKGNDDRDVSTDIVNSFPNNKNVISINNEYTPEELKGIIGQCDLFIGARMHACIASTSMFVPTIAIAYSHKTHGIIGEMLNYEKYVIDIKELTYELLVSKVEDAWKNKEIIRNELKISIPIIQEQSKRNGVLVKQLLDELRM